MQTTTEQKRIEINEENPKVLLLCYGTLLSGYGNNRLLKGKSTLLGEHITEPNFTMYTTGGFPIVSPNGNTAIHGEVYEVTDNNVLQSVHNLEGFGGIMNHPRNWYDVMPVETEFGTAYMYVQPNFSNNHIIESGNWNNQ
jgi:gamma-glutamylcyclotransferase (GGCT)/AIG2-like uncharacterized protein YtfP